MPIREYFCNLCQKSFEDLILSKDEDKDCVQCKYCKNFEAKRIMSLNSFILKGSGWYKTDYQNKDIKNQNYKKEKVLKSKKG